MLDLFACSFLRWLQCSWAASSLFSTSLFSRHSLFPKSMSVCLQGRSKNEKIHSLRGDVFLATWRSWVVLLLCQDAGRLGRDRASWRRLLFACHLLGSYWIMGLLALNLLNWIVARLVVESSKRFASGIDASISRAWIGVVWNTAHMSLRARFCTLLMAPMSLFTCPPYYWCIWYYG